MYKVQSVIFNKKTFSLYLCKQWLKHHFYTDKGVDDKGNFYRFRQFNPDSLKKQGYTEFRTKKLGKTGIELIIAYKGKSGGKISNDDLHHFIHASYNHGENYKNWKLDSSLSDASVQVYYNGKDAVVVHRGSQDAQDWYENGRMILGLDTGKRLDHSRKIQKKAEEKYGANNVITIGHSKGAHHAEEVGQNSREIYTLNKPVTPSDIISGKKVSEKQTDIRTTLDPVSILRPLQQGSDYQNIWSKTLNPLTEHLDSVLNRVNPAKWWGRGRGSCKKISGDIYMKSGSGSGSSVPITPTSAPTTTPADLQRKFDENNRFILSFFNGRSVNINRMVLNAIRRRVEELFTILPFISTDENIVTLKDILTLILEVSGLPERDESWFFNAWEYMKENFSSPFLLFKNPTKTKITTKNAELDNITPRVLRETYKIGEFDQPDWFLGEVISLRSYIGETTHWNEHRYDVLEERLVLLIEYIQANHSDPNFENLAHAFIRFCKDMILRNNNMTNTILRLVQPVVEHLQNQFPEVIQAESDKHLSGKGRELCLSYC